MANLGCAPSIHHLSHPHELKLKYTAQQSYVPSPCSGCKLPVSEWFYVCEPCNHSLHISCAQMPLSLNHPAHPHPLNLEFFPPYQNNNVFCDLCSNSGFNHWLYRCAPCQFDAHMGCATSQPSPVQAQQLQMTNRGVNLMHSERYQANGPLTGGLTYTPRPAYSASVGYNMSPGQRMGQQGRGSQRGGMGLGNSLVQQGTQGVVYGVGQRMGQNLMETMWDLGGGSGDHSDDDSDGDDDDDGDGDGSSWFDF